jgi:tRNA A-37 threonylcarbamoyl transferase component Bud32/tetratricopeptide (TPR) repeat protein
MNIEAIFTRALEIEDEPARRQYLDMACAGDSAIRQRVESLLAAHQEAASFLESPTREIAGGTSPPPDAGATFPPAVDRPIAEAPGTLVGRYKLLQQIGEGGMGVVYMAEQEKPVRRRVALKIIKPGMDSAQVIARFEAERQALAMMDHPNIARVLDAGTTDTGRPYFVMELVQGIPITQYCDDKQLDTHARLELFIQVCNAIQHAHQKGIIHRDLKPSNVLIAIYDAKPVPKIIDFGVAKALHQRLTERTMFTQFGAVVGTLEYMSPEQADMDLMGTDTRSDIYSLGVLLYELLTGSTPMDGKKLRSLGYAEMLKTIREVEPPKPSTRLTQSRNEMPTISARRQTEPRRLQRLVTGDLDWIVMKCLEKDRTRRYESANGLAIDIQRHLRDEAVSASPPGQLYKFQKLVRRNKLVFAAVACVMLALIVGLAASLWEAGRAAREAERANHEADQARSAEHQVLATLDELRATAPTFAAEAEALAAKGKFDLAIEKLDYAAKLHPDAPEYLVSKGDLYLCQFKLSDAAAVYHDVLRLSPTFAPAQAKAQLCDQILAAPRSEQGKFNLESLAKIYTALEPPKRSAAELKAVSDSYTDEKERLWNYWAPRVQSLPMFAKVQIDISPMEGTQHFNIRDDGRLILYLRDVDCGDLSQLKDLPIADIYLSNSLNVSDLRPLADMPGLENVTVPFAARNIDALHKLPKLKRLSFSYTPSMLSTEQESQILSLIYRTQGIGQAEIGQAGTAKAADIAAMNSTLRRAVFFDIKGSWISTTPNTTADEFWKEYYTSWMSRLRDSAIKPNSMSRQTDGTWDLNFDKEKQFTDLAMLQGMPISSLGFGETPVSDLGPLRGMPLKGLSLWWTNVTDLSPIKGIALTYLDISWSKINDLSPIKGMPLGLLKMDGIPVTDLAALRGMPLKILHLRDSPNLTDLSPLADSKELTELVLPPNFTDFQFLHTFPKLQRLSFDENESGYWLADKSTDEFWAALPAEQPWAAPLHKAGITYKLRRTPERSWEMILNNQPLSDLSMLKGGNITVLSLANTPLTDLSPLTGMNLTALRLSDTKVIDLSPLAGMGDTLESMTLPPNAKNIEFLRKFPELKRLSYKYDMTANAPAQTADQFWAEYDQKKNGSATRPAADTKAN